MNILEKEFTPLNEAELDIIAGNYMQDFNKMEYPQAVTLLKMLLSTNKSFFDKDLHGLLIRRLYMIIEWDKHPERLL